MNNILIFDIEANGLLDTVDAFHCACGQYTDGSKFETTDAGILTAHLMSTEIIVGHNIIDYDLPLLKKLFGYEHRGKVLDTLVLSRLLQPERVGRHSLECWGERVGITKPEHEDWSVFTPEMMHRCEQDVKINIRVLTELMLEADTPLEDLIQLPQY